MQQDQVKEQLTAFAPGAVFSAFAVTIAESHIGAVITYDLPVTDHPTIQVRLQKVGDVPKRFIWVSYYSYAK